MKEGRLVKLISKRKELGFTQVHMASALNLKIDTYRNYEQGRRKPTPKTLREIAEVLNCTIDELI